MELDFDKEIDALLRKARRDSPAAVGVSGERHLDADELSAFTENALPEKSRAFYVAHLADCDACRRTLVEMHSLSADAAPVAASASVPAVAAADVPWWRKLFTMPNLAYTMGTLVLLCSGLMGYLVLQRSPASREAQVARVTEPAAPPSYSANANTTSVMSNTATTAANTMANTSSTNPLGDVPRSGVSVGTSNVPTESDSKPEAKTEQERTAVENEERRDVSPPPPTSAPVIGGQPSAAAASPPPKPAEKVAKDEKAERQSANVLVDGAATQDLSKKQMENLPLNGRSADSLKMRSAPSGPRQMNNQNQISQQSVQVEKATSRSVGGRRFEFKDGVWYDTSFSGAPTINVRRGTDEFKKLDDGLRSIANKLDGTIVVVWKGKSYRIQ